ncbi:MAG: hypothetical protein ACK5LY_08340 [Lachnospirales bacterium]
MLIYGIVCSVIPLFFILLQAITDTLYPLNFYFGFDFLTTYIMQLVFIFVSITFFKNKNKGFLKYVHDIILGIIALLTLSTLLTLSKNNNVTALRIYDESSYIINTLLYIIATLNLIFGIYLLRTKKMPFKLKKIDTMKESDKKYHITITSKLIILTSIPLYVAPLNMLPGTNLEYFCLFLYNLILPYLLFLSNILNKSNTFIVFDDELSLEQDAFIPIATEIHETNSSYYNHINKEIRKLQGEDKFLF